MRNKSVFNFRRALPCMSWSPKNLYNLWRRTAGPNSEDILFKKTSDATLFQQRWKSKAAVRAYHGDYIPEKVFKRWYLPDSLPDVRPRRQIFSGDNLDLELYARRKLKEKQQEDEIEEKGLAPVGSLMFSEVERRIDTVVFRSCFAHSIYEARRLIIHGDVMLNGKKHTNATTRLAPGDMISVNPEAIRFFKRPNGEYDDVNAGENRVKLMEDEATDKAKAELTGTDVEETSESSSVEPQTTEPTLKSRNSKPPLTPFYLPPYASPWLFIPAYIEPSFATCSAVYVRHPTARPGYSEIPTPYDADGTLVRYAWEWYVQRRPRMRSKKQLSRMPEDRTKLPLVDIGEERKLLLMDVKPTRKRGYHVKDVRKYSDFGSQ